MGRMSVGELTIADPVMSPERHDVELDSLARTVWGLCVPKTAPRTPFASSRTTPYPILARSARVTRSESVQPPYVSHERVRVAAYCASNGVEVCLLSGRPFCVVARRCSAPSGRPFGLPPGYGVVPLAASSLLLVTV
jgi:hypothetical protein